VNRDSRRFGTCGIEDLASVLTSEFRIRIKKHNVNLFANFGVRHANALMNDDARSRSAPGVERMPNFVLMRTGQNLEGKRGF
jgi:hypothetical protein